MRSKTYEKFHAEDFYDEVLAELSRCSLGVLTLRPGPGHMAHVKSRLLNYASRTRELDKIFDQLEAKHYCATQCPRPSRDCCWEHAYRMGNEDFFEFLAVQEVEARVHGWQQPGRMCRYQMDQGCPISLFKPPACVRHMCVELKDSLAARFGGQVQGLADSLQRISQDIQRGRTILDELDQAIAAGRSILTLRRPDAR